MPVQPRAGKDPEQDSRGKRLESWKEIAGYLNRHVTTIRRWERHEGLPAHRHRHSKLGSIYAYTRELDVVPCAHIPCLGEGKWNGMSNPTCPECARLQTDLADATIAYVEADSNRKAFLPGEPFGETDAKRQKELDQAVEKTLKRRDDLSQQLHQHHLTHL